jgi:PleD family two-component response regulator
MKVLAAVDDLFFAAKIKAAAESAGAAAVFAKTHDAALAQARQTKPDLIIVDLQAARCQPFALAATCKADDALRGIPLIGFFSHVHTAVMRQAQTVGYDQVWPRSAFVKRLPEVLGGNSQLS